MKTTQSYYQIPGIKAYNWPVRNYPPQDIQRHLIVGIVEGRNNYRGIAKVEIGITGR